VVGIMLVPQHAGQGGRADRAEFHQNFDPNCLRKSHLSVASGIWSVNIDEAFVQPHFRTGANGDLHDRSDTG